MVCLNRVQSSRRLEREAGTYARLVSNLILRTLGLLTIAPDVSAKLALTTIASLTVLGALQQVRKVRPLWPIAFDNSKLLAQRAQAGRTRRIVQE